jgi:hypothetical protein
MSMECDNSIKDKNIAPVIMQKKEFKLNLRKFKECMMKGFFSVLL